MRKISANYIYPGNSSPIKNGVIVVNKDGVIDRILNPKETDVNWDSVEQYEGIICPGFINTHCHLELSYLKGKIAKSTQLHGFVKTLISIRNNFSKEERMDAMHLAEHEMFNNGIVAVGDISNGDSSFEVKENSKIKYHTFIEVFGSDPKIAKAVFETAETIYASYFNCNRAAITPHATYSVSNQLAQLIDRHATKKGHIISFHNQETASENTFFKEGKGEMFDLLDIATKTNHQFEPTGKNSLPSFLEKLNPNHKTLLVHNTFTKEDDIAWANKYASNIYWCFCPNANEYIENTQPNYSIFSHENCTIGTDSLASNKQLSILEELKTIAKKDPAISLEVLIKWGTYNGAKFLGFDELGAIEKGKSPGLNLISNVVSRNLTPSSKVQKIL